MKIIARAAFLLAACACVPFKGFFFDTPQKCAADSDCGVGQACARAGVCQKGTASVHITGVTGDLPSGRVQQNIVISGSGFSGASTVSLVAVAETWDLIVQSAGAASITAALPPSVASSIGTGVTAKVRVSEAGSSDARDVSVLKGNPGPGAFTAGDGVSIGNQTISLSGSYSGTFTTAGLSVSGTADLSAAQVALPLSVITAGASQVCSGCASNTSPYFLIAGCPPGGTIISVGCSTDATDSIVESALVTCTEDASGNISAPCTLATNAIVEPPPAANTTVTRARCVGAGEQPTSVQVVCLHAGT